MRSGRLAAVGETAERSTPPRVIVFSERELIAHGVIGLLPEGWETRATVAADLVELEAVAADPFAALIVDAPATGAGYAAAHARALGGIVIALLDAAGTAAEPALLEQADAVLVRDDVEPSVLRLALAAGRTGMRLLPWSLPALQEAVDGPEATELGEPARQALTLLGEGLRDAEIARELNLSESAVRKLIQRTVKRTGARTRAQAVAEAVRRGLLG